MGKKLLTMLLSLILLFTVLAGCKKDDDSKEKEDLGTTPTVITVAGSWTDCTAIDEVGRLFKAEYPNVTIVYENIQNYSENVIKRMTGDEKIDLFFTTNIQEGSTFLPYSLDLNNYEGLDLTETFAGLIDNFVYRDADPNTNNLYAIPLGAEMRGMYVNKTLLKKYNIVMPTNKTQLLSACETLKNTTNPITNSNYIPFHSNPMSFAQHLVYPWIANIVANSSDYQTTFNKVNNREAGMTELFREPCQFVYDLVSNYYYDYKTAQNQGLFKSVTDADVAKDFLNIKKTGDTFAKVDDLGQVAFMPSTLGMKGTLDTIKEDYHSNIEYEFIPAPLDENGGFVYLSPAHGIAVNKNSSNLKWTIRFLDFLFMTENNKVFAENFNIIPNTSEALNYITELYDVPSTNICHLGQVSFDYSFYEIMVSIDKDLKAAGLTNTVGLMAISKGNNPSYMKTEGDAKVLYPFEYYFSALKSAFEV